MLEGKVLGWAAETTLIRTRWKEYHEVPKVSVGLMT